MRWKNIKSNSWFDILKSKKNIKIKRTTNKTKVLRTKQINIYPDEKQKLILNNWFHLSDEIYNITTKYINKRIWKEKNLDFNKCKLYVNHYNLRRYLKKDVERIKKKNNINAKILDQSIARCVSMYKSSISNFKRTHKKFRIRKLKPNKRYKNLIIEKLLFSTKENAFCIRLLGKMKSDFDLRKITKTTILKYDSITKRYTLHTPLFIEAEILVNKVSCGIDPGLRTFLCVYSRRNCYQICNNINFNNRFLMIDKLNERYKNNKQSKKYKKLITKSYDKINNKIKDMHFKVAKLLCRNFNYIKLGNLSTSKIIKRTNNLPKKSRRIANVLSHYKFRQILLSQAEKYGCKLDIVSEYMTTKKCSNCGNIKEVGKNKIYECDKCELVMDRDLNAAKNILAV